MTSYQLNKCLIIDARDHIMGRLASTVAKHLMMGTRIIVLRCERIVMSGHLIRNKLKMKYFRNKKMNTNPRRGPFQYLAPSRMFYRVVRGMIPHKKPKGKRMLALFNCYDGCPPRYQHIRKVRVIPAFRHLRLDPNRPYTSLGRLMTTFGWTHGKLMVKLEEKRRLKTAQVWKIQKEIFKLKERAIKKVATKYAMERREEYDWMAQYDHTVPLSEDLLNPDAGKKQKGKKADSE